MAFGYAISVSLTQLARIYGAIADHGIIRPISFLKLKHPAPGKQLMPPKIANDLITMLHTVVGTGGTGLLANIPGYNVAGKTGTAHKTGPHGFYKNRYNAIFVGMVPMHNPRVVIAVHINDPQGHFNAYGGVSAAPVFASVGLATMHILGVPPTDPHVNVKFFKSQQELLHEIAGA